MAGMVTLTLKTDAATHQSLHAQMLALARPIGLLFQFRPRGRDQVGIVDLTTSKPLPSSTLTDDEIRPCLNLRFVLIGGPYGTILATACSRWRELARAVTIPSLLTVPPHVSAARRRRHLHTSGWTDAQVDLRVRRYCAARRTR